MNKTRLGGNKDGIGLYELVKLGMTRNRAIPYHIAVFAIKCNLNTISKKFLGIK